MTKVASMFGHELIPKWRAKQFPLYQHLRRVFELYDIGCVLDVGANRGQYVDYLRADVRFEGPIISFEPDPDNSACLEKRASSDQNWHIRPHALGSEEGKAILYRTNTTVFSSLHKPNEYGKTTFGESVDIESEQLVQVRTLDSVLLEHEQSLGRPVERLFLKTDTQGHDHEVLRGATKSLPRVVGIQMEVAARRIYEDMPTLAESLQILEELGFQLSGLYPVSVDRELRVVEFDCIALRVDRLPREKGDVRRTNGGKA